MARKEHCYAWFVVFCSFMLHLITDGVAYTFGIFFTALLNDLHSSKALAAWVPSIMTGLTYGVGPLAAALTDRYGCRTIALLGTCLTSFGFAIASVAGGVFSLYGSIGLLAGAGFGLIYLPAVVCLTQHFSRHLALATGLAVSASGIGTALFAPLTEQLINMFGWRSAMRFVSCLLLCSGGFALSFGSPTTSGQSTPEDSALDDDDDSRKKIVHFSKHRQCSIESLNELPDENKLNGNKSFGHKVSLRLDVEKANCLNKDNLNDWSCANEGTLNLTSVSEDHKNKSLSNYESTSPSAIMESMSAQQMQTSPLALFNNQNPTRLHHQSHSNLSHGMRHFAHAHHRPPMYKSHGNLHNHHGTGIGRTDHTLLSTPIAPLDSILLLSTSLTSINYCADTHSKSIENHLHSRRESSSANHNASNGCDTMICHNHTNLNDINNNTNNNSNTNNNNCITSVSNDNINDKIINTTKSINSINVNNSRSSRRPSIISSISCSHPNSPCNVINSNLINSTATSSIHHNSVNTSGANHPNPAQNTCSTLRALLSFSLLKEPLFVWFALSNFLTSLGYYVPHIYIKERCLVLQHPVVPEHCSYLLSLIGVSSTVGRIFFGFLSDFERCNRLMLYSHCLVLCGLATAFTPFAYNYWLLGLFCVAFGLTTGAFVSLTTVILVDLLGVAKLTNAFGLLLLFQGAASLTGPPIIGLLYDLTNSYNEGFVFAGVAMAISGFMLYFVPYLCNKHSVIDLS